MLIKAYLFSKIAMQLGHTYYSVPNYSTGSSKFYYNLNDYDIENFLLNESFIYEVEIYPETVFICSDKYLQARKYKIVRYVRLIEYLEKVNLPDDVAKELNAIFNCSNSNLLETDFYDLFNQAPEQLSPYEKLKFLAILNRVQNSFPMVTLKEYYQIHYIKLFEFYQIPYCCTVANIPIQEAKRERLFGLDKFEVVYNRTEELLEKAKSDNALISHLIIGRKLTQKQFEKLCDLAIDPGIWFAGFCVCAIISGYKIPPKHEIWFYPYIGYHKPDDVESLIKNKIMLDKDDILMALENNYIIKGERYWNSYHQKIFEAKKIFLKDGFKIIERN